MMNIERTTRASAPLAGLDAQGPARAEETALQRRPVDPHAAVSQEILAKATSTNLLYAMQVALQQSQQDLGRESILNKKAVVETERHIIQQAMERAAHEAQEKAGWAKWTGVLSTIVKIAAVAGAAASVVASGGLSAPVLLGLAGTVMSVMAKPIADATGGGKTLESALMYGGAALSLGAGGYGALVGNAAKATGTAAQLAGVASKAAGVVGGAATAGTGVTSAREAHHAARELDARADETAARAQKKQTLKEIDQLIEVLKEVEKSFGKAKATLAKAMDSESASALTLATMGVKA